DLLLDEGIIKGISRFIHIPKDAIVINGKNKIVTPGLVDMHSHIGVDSWPMLVGTDDTNEMTSPATPMLRTLDAFNQDDLALPIVMSGGITTTLVLPGSANVMGGEAFVFKLRPIKSKSNEEALVNYNDQSNKMPWRYMKFACGENPKRVYGEQGKTPSTRMGSGYLMREMFSKASQLVREQDEWCDFLKDHFNEVDIRKGRVHSITKEFPTDIKLESLSNVIRGNVQPHIHCYEPEDLETVIRASEDYGFQIWAFHHALSAYRVPELIKRAGRYGFNVTVATFSDGWGYKKEAYEEDPRAPIILTEHNIPVALKSDHPVINSQTLMFEATKAYHNGLDAKHALASITSNPAKALGLGHKIGGIQIGMDADLVLWNEIPFTVGATPEQVIIDGILMFPEKYEDDENQELNAFDYNNPIQYPKIKNEHKKPKCYDGLKSFILKGVNQVIMNNSTKAMKIQKNKVLLIENGKITEIEEMSANKMNLKTVYADSKAWMIPGLIGVATKLGLNEIIQEDSTGDGNVKNIDPFKYEDYPRAIDGLTFEGKHLKRAFKGGITAAVSAPLLGSGIINGYSTSFFTNGNTAYLNEDIVNPVTALHLAVGYEYLDSTTTTISQQFLKIRQLFLKAIEQNSKDWPKATNLISQVIKGLIPVVVRAHNKDDIIRLIQLRNLIRDKFHQSGGFGLGLDLIILGGAEAWLVADELSYERIKVILQPVRCVPDTWSKRRCLTGAPLTKNTTFTVLNKAGVELGFAPDEDGEYAHNLIWEASWAYHQAKGELSEIEAIGLVSWNLQEMFHLNQ
ncbi:hypothetical protein K502DRAFT_275315, partial [Neoconidiobolus thromboides FSU 785]